MALVACNSSPSSKTPPAYIAGRETDVAYLQDRFGTDATAACAAQADDYLRSIARYDFAWDRDATGMFGVKFDRYSTIQFQPGTLTAISTRAKLSNAFGAFEHIRLYCVYDVKTDRVIGMSNIDPLTELPPKDAQPVAASAPIVVHRADDNAPPPDAPPSAPDRDSHGMAARLPDDTLSNQAESDKTIDR